LRYTLRRGEEKFNQEDINRVANLLESYEVNCKLCDNIFQELEKFAQLVIDKLEDYEFKTFLIGSRVDKEITDKEEALWSELKLTYPEPIKTEINREVGKLIASRLHKKVDFSSPELTAIIDTRYDSIELNPAPLFIYGRYRKFSRSIPQTKWPCKRCWGRGCKYCKFTGKIYSISVEEIIASKFMEYTQGSEHLFHGLGREDVDVRVLGTGRPFVLEIRVPKKRLINLKALQKEINQFGKSVIEVFDLRFTNSKEVVRIKSARTAKTYRVKVEFSFPVEEQKIKELENRFTNTVIAQRTPLRVVHRRADKVRERKVFKFEVKEAASREASFIVKTAPGLYIKELITGDNGRTMPSVSETLGIAAEVKELDVLAVEYG
jgi:tRNA pseudouridine synthase 10